MHRFRLLALYVAGIVAAVAVTIGVVSMRRTADDQGAREASAEKNSGASARRSDTPCQPSLLAEIDQDARHAFFAAVFPLNALRCPTVRSVTDRFVAYLAAMYGQGPSLPPPTA
jgi:hypothetical protein